MHSVSGRSPTEATVVLKGLQQLSEHFYSGALCIFVCCAGFHAVLPNLTLNLRHRFLYTVLSHTIFFIPHLLFTSPYLILENSIYLNCFYLIFGLQHVFFYILEGQSLSVLSSVLNEDPASNVFCMLVPWKTDTNITKNIDILPLNSVIWQFL